MALEALSGLPDGARYALAGVTTLVLLWWTYRRVVGDGEDPSIALSGGNGTGYGSLLLSGILAVAFVAGGWILGLGPEIAATPELLAIPGAFVAAHLYVEVRES
jgi:hypothetical protein